MGKSSKKPPLGMVMLGIVIIAVLLFFATDGKMNLKNMSKTVSAPSDKEENMAYNELFRSVSANTLERDGIILRAKGSELMFYALAGKTTTSDGSELMEDLLYSLTDISQRSDREIQQISEYMGYFYMYDGESVYRIHTTNPEIKLTVENCTKFEPMGNYIYSIKEKDGQPWLHRCQVTGADEHYLFKEGFVDFWCHSGEMLLKRSDGSYMWYDVVGDSSMERSFNASAFDFCLYDSSIFYLMGEGNEARLYSSPATLAADQVFIDAPIASYCIAEGYCAYLSPSPSGLGLYVRDMVSGETVEYTGMSFEEGCQVDVSKNSVFVTDSDGRCFYSPLFEDSWKEIFVE